MVSLISSRSGLAAFVVAMAFAVSGLPSALAQDVPAAWRVECAGDGKTLRGRAIQQMINREDKQLVAQLLTPIAAHTNAAVLLIQPALGLSLTEPVQLKGE